MKHIVRDHFDVIASRYDGYKKDNWYYYQNVQKIIKRFIPEGKRVLELGCGTGDILSLTKPSFGIGVDISSNMISIARNKHPQKTLKFIISDINDFHTGEKFDYIFMTDVMEHLTDVPKSLGAISDLMDKKTKFLNIMANPWWEWFLIFAEKLGLKMPEGPHHRIKFQEVERILIKYNLNVVSYGRTTLLPVYIPVLTDFLNRHIEPKMKRFACIEYFQVKKTWNKPTTSRI